MQVSPASHLWPLMGFSKRRKKKAAYPAEDLNLSHVYNLVKYCSRRFSSQFYSDDHHFLKDKMKKVFPQPFQELFLWAVLVGR